MTQKRLESLRQQRDQLNARIQRESAKERSRERKARNSRLIQWGIVIEAMLNDGRITSDKWASECQRYLTKQHDLRRALTGELAAFSDQKQDNTNDYGALVDHKQKREKSEE